MGRPATDANDQNADDDDQMPPLLDFAPYIYMGRRHRPSRTRQRCLDSWCARSYALLACLDGSLELVAGGRRTLVTAGNCALVEPRVIPYANPGARCLSLVFDPVHRRRSLAPHASHIRCGMEDRRPQPSWQELFGYPLTPPIPEAFGSRTIDLLLNIIEDYWVDARLLLRCNAALGDWLLDYDRLLQPAPPRSISESDPVRLAEYLIDLLLRDGPDCATIAARCHLSRSQLDRQFRARRGYPLYEAMQRRREQLARQLLGDRSLTLAEIADRIGLQSDSAFCTWFKRRTGDRPRECTHRGTRRSCRRSSPGDGG